MKKRILIFGAVVVGLIGFIIWGNSSAAEQTDSFSIDGIGEICVTTNDTDIYFTQSSDNNIRVAGAVLNSQQNGASVRLENSTLLINQGETKQDLFGGFSFQNNRKIEIELPQDYLEKITVNSQSGDITFKSTALGQATIKSDSGDIYLQKISINESASIETQQGDIDLVFANEPENLTIEAVAQDVANQRETLKFGNGKNHLELFCKNGSLALY